MHVRLGVATVALNEISSKCKKVGNKGQDTVAFVASLLHGDVTVYWGLPRPCARKNHA